MIEDSEVDDIIKQHLMEEEQFSQKPRKAIKKKPKKKSGDKKKSKDKPLNEDLAETEE